MVMDTNITDIRAVVPPLTEASLCTWLGAAAPGDSITYHRGALARQVCPQLQCLPEQERTALQRLAARAWKRPLMALRIVTADERLSRAANKTTMALFDPSGVGNANSTSQG